MSVRDRLKNTPISLKSENLAKPAPVWAGPESDKPNGGVTFSLLSRFLRCRERFRCLAVEGLKAKSRFSHKMEYGSMFHRCEQHYLRSGNATTGNTRGLPGWRVKLNEYVNELAEKYPYDVEAISKWYEVCKVQFPAYCDFWNAHPDTLPTTPLLEEEVFDIPYRLGSGRVCRLRGRWDSVGLVSHGEKSEVWLRENKTKGDIDPSQLQRQLTFDLQTMMYLIALRESMRMNLHPPMDLSNKVAKGVVYNVIRRPLSGGKGTITQHKPSKKNPGGESKADYYKRVEAIIREEPGHYFMRWTVEITGRDIDNFKTKCLDPVLENLCDWWAEVSGGKLPLLPYKTPMNYQYPFGVWNPMDHGEGTEYDEYLNSGSLVGLHRVENLFPELEEKS